MHIELWCSSIQGANFFPSACFGCFCFAWQLFMFPQQPFPVPREQLWTSGIQLGVIYTGRWRMWCWHWINSKNDENLILVEKKSCVLFAALHTLVLLKRLLMYLIYDEFLVLRSIITKAKSPSPFFFFFFLHGTDLSLQTNYRQHFLLSDIVWHQHKEKMKQQLWKK